MANEFEEGNKAAEKWKESECADIFQDILTRAMSDQDVLSMDDVMLLALTEHKMPFSTFKYLVKKFPVLANKKEAILAVIRSRINKHALKGDYNATASIWRFKQLGERDPDKQAQTDALKGLKFKITED